MDWPLGKVIEVFTSPDGNMRLVKLKTISGEVLRPRLRLSIGNYKGGNIVGMTYNSSNLATSVQVCMLQSLFSPYKDVIHIVPIDTFDASKLFHLMKKVIMGLEEIGFKAMGMVTDNNSINRAA
ncbi:hypothetical protein AVEN_250701-1, partial [Araneus ventricosus]